jgi:regulation of enolase protein 1 (concanavalin A-like superfamily)
MTAIDAGDWLNPPMKTELSPEGFTVTASEKSDFWRETSYGFVHNDGHALLNDFPQDSALELSWMLNYREQFDQAGLMVYHDDRNWIKAGVEFADGSPQLGAVVTNGKSDWSVAPVSEWMNKEVFLRFSRTGDALTIRAKAEGEWRLVRLVPLDPNLDWKVGLFCASPTRAGLKILFKSLKVTEHDKALHE